MMAHRVRVTCTFDVKEATINFNRYGGSEEGSIQVRCELDAGCVRQSGGGTHFGFWAPLSKRAREILLEEFERVGIAELKRYDESVAQESTDTDGK